MTYTMKPPCELEMGATATKPNRFTHAFAALATLFVLGGMGLFAYLVAFLIGQGVVKRGLKVLAALVLIILVGQLPQEPQWSKLLKRITLGGIILWAIYLMLPIDSMGDWLLSLAVAGLFGLFGYVILLEDFFGS